MYAYRRALLAPTLSLVLAALACGPVLAREAVDAPASSTAAPYDAAHSASDSAVNTSASGVSGNSSLSADASTGPIALSSADRLSYTTAFDALRRGDLELARASARKANDRVLLGQVEFERLFHPDHVATYEELSAWLEEYADLPCATRVYTLALRRRPDGAEEPKRPAGVGARTWNTVVAAGGGSTESDPAKAARVALNRDDLTTAYTLGVEIGDWWTAALAAWRLGQFNESFQAFERVAVDPTEDPWVRAGAGVWAAKAAGKTGRQDRIAEFLHLSARWPATFYGQVALRQLGEEPTIENMGPRPYETASLRRAAYHAEDANGVDFRTLNAFIQSDDRARRTVALIEVGRGNDAQSELRNGLRTAVGDTARALWVGLARALGSRFNGDGDATRIDATHYAMPELTPEGGFTIERSLVYALARKETGFNAAARSSAGAYGIMQVMPTTAAEMTGDKGFVSQPQRLLEPSTNLKLGQTYINRMLSLPAFQGDLLRAVASYNAGPGPMLAAVRKLGPDADPLLLIETIDVPQARDYVEKVVAAYWIYQRMFGGPLNTLDAVAAGATLIPISLDYVAPKPVAMEMASAPTPVGGL